MGTGGDPEIIRESCKKRFVDPVIVDEIVELDEKYRKRKPINPIHPTNMSLSFVLALLYVLTN